MLALFAFQDQLRSPYLSFINNTAAQFALSKGYSSDDAVNTLSSIFWASAAEWGSAPWFERVSSQANIPDGVSRGDFREAGQLGARQLEFDFHKVWDELIGAVRNNKFVGSCGTQSGCDSPSATLSSCSYFSLPPSLRWVLEFGGFFGGRSGHRTLDHALLASCTHCCCTRQTLFDASKGK